ncbi:MAG: hypothetical protein AAGA83_25475 [Cyanobacteria bacterium P01_F01_bin.116]
MSSVTTSVTPSICLAPEALLPRGTGSKRKHIPKLANILTCIPFDTVVEPFGQGLWITQALHQAENSTLKVIRRCRVHGGHAQYLDGLDYSMVATRNRNMA